MTLGILDWFLGPNRKQTQPTVVPDSPRQTPRPATPAVAPAPAGTAKAATDTSRGAGTHQVSRHAEWHPQNSPVTVSGCNLPGMVYVGRGLASPKANPDPSLIDPSLKVDKRRPDTSGRTLGYWPSYAKLTPGARAAYLAWLSGGRVDPSTPVGYVFIFFYGLERRALVDIAADKSLTGEVADIRAEVRRLLGIYGSNGSFNGYASAFLSVLDLLEAAAADPVAAQPPPLQQLKWPTPLRLKTALGVLASENRPVPANWALAWAWYHPEVYPRTPAARCPREFAALFTTRYTQKHGDGLKVRPTGRPLKIEYRTASAAIGTADLELTSTPDVFDSAAPGRSLRELFDKVTDELDPYSRWVGRNPNPTPRQALAGAALLPEGLAHTNEGVREFQTWVEHALTSGDQCVIDGRDLLARWPVANPEKMAKPETTAMATLLSQFGVGVEPDVRLGGQAIVPGPIVLFRTGPVSPQAATPTYAAATTLLHLAAVVSAADGHVSEHEQNHLVEHLNAALHLTEGERTRLAAHLTWLLSTDLKTTGLKRRLEALTHAQREGIGQLLVTVAAADGVISPDEVTSLSKIYTLLGLDPATVTSRLHMSMTEPTRPATAPVQVRPGSLQGPGFAVPAPAPHDAAGTPSPAPLVLDDSVIAAKLEQTAEVTALLRTLFTDDDEAAPTRLASAAPVGDSNPPPAPAGEVATDGSSPAEAIAGLDPSTSALLRQLASRPAWPRHEFDALAASFGVMPDGAIDVLNEAALDATGEPLLEGDDELEVNSEGLEGLLV